MIIDAPAVDWLTFTTYENDHFQGWQDWQRKLVGDKKIGKIRMYDGEWVGSSFIGQGRQGSRPHGLVRVSGTESNQAFIDLLKIGYDKCTRLDIQFTTPLPSGYSARKFADDLRLDQAGEYQRSVELYENSDGFDTVYVGSKKSDRFARFYVKEADDQRYLRFEIEHKNDWAQIVAKSLQSGNAEMAGVMLDFLDTIKVDDTQGIIRKFHDLLDSSKAGLINPRNISDDSAFLKWFDDQVTPACLRKAFDHEIGADLRYRLQKLLDEVNITIGGEIDKNDLL
jgi:hypothetical protein